MVSWSASWVISGDLHVVNIEETLHASAIDEIVQVGVLVGCLLAKIWYRRNAPSVKHVVCCLAVSFDSGSVRPAMMNCLLSLINCWRSRQPLERSRGCLELITVPHVLSTPAHDVDCSAVAANAPSCNDLLPFPDGVSNV